MPLAANPLIQVTPGLMIWTIVCFLITLFVLKRYAFGPVQKLIDDRRERIRQSLEEADHAREEARNLLEEHRKLIAGAQTDAEQILSEARRVADANERRMREELEADRQRRLEETRKQIEGETRRALEQIRLEVVDLSLLAATKVTRKSLDDADHRRLIEEAVGEPDKLLGQIEQASGRKVEATRTVDPELIGGIVLQVGSHRLDASVRGRLDRLRRQLVTA